VWARTYGCLLDEMLQAEVLANEARLLAQLKDDLE
jgi:hypothetical protein